MTLQDLLLAARDMAHGADRAIRVFQTPLVQCRGVKEAPGPSFDLVVIGGGINGAGIARDAAMRGLSVCLVEKNDWGWGTSAKSSMLAHGGLRYLEQFELGLVHEALQDRELMFQHAPHLVHPLEFIYPLYPHIASRRTVRVGLWLYDLLSHGKSVPKRDYLKREEVLKALPGINRTDLLGGASYYDGQWHSVERFVAELVMDAKSHGAVCLNHTAVQRLIVEDGRCVGVELAADPAVTEAVEALRGVGATEASLRVHAGAVINAAGPWVDDVLQGASVATPRLIRGTKGIHIVVPRFVEKALIIRAKDGRTFFILPWHEHCLVGTTDTDFEGDPGTARATPEEVAYLQESARFYFPKAPLDKIQWTYAGVRPLVHETGLMEGHVTRRHILHDHSKEGATNLWSVQGGKLTTYRHLAEQAVDTVAKALRRRDARQHPTRTARLPGAPEGKWSDYRDAAVAAATTWGTPPALARRLVHTYGVRWKEIVLGGDDGGLEEIDETGVFWCEVDNAVRNEMAVTVADVMLRRTRLGLGGAGRPKVAKQVARRMATHLAWDGARIKAELRAYDVAISAIRVP